jgi:hypothetical protein
MCRTRFVALSHCRTRDRPGDDPNPTVRGCGGNRQREDSDASLDASVTLCKREIIQGANDAKTYARPMPANARAILIEALRDAHRWLDELLSDPRQTLESIASREGKTDRSIRMTLSLAFLAADIVKAAVEGRLPRGYGLKCLVDLPTAWPDQWRPLGLQAPAQVEAVSRRPPTKTTSSMAGARAWRRARLCRCRLAAPHLCIHRT